MSNPNYVPPELVEKAREIDLPTYFEMFEPGQLKRLSSSVYCTNEHDSLKMSNGKWFWWSRGIGGKNAIDFLILSHSAQSKVTSLRLKKCCFCRRKTAQMTG